MGTSTSERKLLLRTDNPQAEILLIDGSFRVVKRGPSPLEYDARPGLYSMKVKVGDLETEELLAVEPGAETFEANLPAPLFESPIPLGATSTTHEYHQSVAERLLQHGAAKVVLGHGCQLMVCVRDPSRTNFAANEPTTSEADRSAYAASFQGLRILDDEFRPVVDLDAQAERNIVDGYLALMAELNPGWYALACRSGEAWVCSPLPVAGGWTLQVYINVVPTGRGRFVLAPDLQGMAVVFGRTAAGFDPWRSEWLAGETVRQGLLEGRNYVDTPTMHGMLTGKFDDPMLGLYGAHLMLAESPPNLPLLEEVLGNLRAMLGVGHPDVVGLTCEVERLAGKDQTAEDRETLAQLIKSLAGPPLLARSWDLLLQATDRYDVDLKAAPGLFKVARDLVPNGGFVAWQRSSLAPAAPAALPAEPPSITDDAAPTLQQPAPAATSPKTKSEPGGLGGLIGAAAALVGPVLGAVTRALKLMRRQRATPEEPNLAAQIAEIDSNEKAAVALAQLARSHDWRRLLPGLRESPAWVSGLGGLQRDLLLLMRDVSGDPVAIDGITDDFVERMLQTHHVTLPVLVDALSDMELSGWLSSSVRNWAKNAARSGDGRERSPGS